MHSMQQPHTMKSCGNGTQSNSQEYSKTKQKLNIVYTSVIKTTTTKRGDISPSKWRTIIITIYLRTFDAHNPPIHSI